MRPKYICFLLISIAGLSIAYSQESKISLREKLTSYYNTPNDFKNQSPGGVDFNFGNGLQFTSKDSTSRLKIELRFQSLFMASKFLQTEDEVSTNFLVRRARLKFGGFAFTPNLQYKVELGLSNRDISPSSDFDEVKKAPKLILDAVVKWKFHKNFTLWMGQTKLPGNRERVISSQKLQFVDRSQLNSKFNLDRDMSLQLHSSFNLQDALFSIIAAFSTGEGRNITQGNIGGFGYTGRVEFLPGGKFSSKGDYFGADLAREKKPKLSLGFSYDFNHQASRVGGRLGNFITDDNGDYLNSDLTTMIGDLMFKYQGFSMMAEFARKKSSERALGFASGTAVVGQMGYIINAPNFKNFELAFRYTKVNPDSGSSLSEIAEYTVGVSKYFLKHSLKLQSDISLQETSGSDHLNLIYRIQSEFAF